MRPVHSSQRRRRLRLIQAEDERAAQRFQTAAAVLMDAVDSEATRREEDAFRRKLFIETRAKSRTKLRVEHPGADPLTVSMDRPYLLIGSDSHSDLILDHEEVAPRHCFVQWIDGYLFCCDLAPRAGRTSVRTQPPNGRWLNSGSISIGPFQIMLEKPSSLPEPEFSHLDRSPSLAEDFPQFALQFKGVEQSDNQWPVNRPLTMIGRGSQCKLRLNHTTMPNVQACLLRTKNSCWLIDVHGAGTTGLNGRTVTIAPIDLGDVLQLGPFQVEVVTTVFEPDDFAPVAKKSKSTSKSFRSAKPPTKSAALPVLEPSPQKRSTSDVEPLVSVADAVAVPSNLVAADSMVDAAIPLVAHKIIDALEPSIASAGVANESVVSVAAQPKLIADFAQTQQSQLTQLKSQLQQIKMHFERTGGRSFSKRVKALLDQTLTDALLTQVSMAESLDKLLETSRKSSS